MILDQFGKPVRRETFQTHEFLMREAERNVRDWDVDRRLRELRGDLDFAAYLDAAPRGGDTVTVRLPKRFTPEAGA